MPIYGQLDQQRLMRTLVADVAQGCGRALVIRGEPGAGKTTFLPSSTRGDPGKPRLRRTCVTPGLHQLAIALGTTPTSAEDTELAVCAGTLEMLLAPDRPLLITVDDIHDLDPDSRRALLFCARRIGFGCDADRRQPPIVSTAHSRHAGRDP